MKSPKFSIIIPVYNVAPYLRECLDSVISQTYTSWEAICVDDGSADESGLILDEYAALDARIKVVHKANGGVSSARNLALESVNGDYVLFLDGDDVLLQKTMLTDLVKIITDTSTHLIAFGNLTKSNFENHCDEKIKRSSTIDLSREISVMPPALWEICYKADLIKGIVFAPMIMGEDKRFVFEVLARAEKLIVLDVAWYGYRKREQSAVKSKFMTDESLSNQIELGALWFETMKAAKKSISLCLARWWAMWLFEEMPFHVLRKDRESQKILLPQIIAAIRRVDCENMPLYPRIVIGMIKALPYRPILWLLGYLPRKLKYMGIHR